MTSRRDHRQTHVRPRPPSTGRPTPVKIKARAPGSTRLAGHRPVRRTEALPIAGRVGLIGLVLVLGVVVLFIGLRGLGSVVGGIGSAVGGFVQGVTSTPAPKASQILVADAPSLTQPNEPYTSEATVDLLVTVPAALIGDTNHQIRLYLTLPDQVATPIQEVPIATTAKTIIPGVQLTDGINDFSVTIIGSSGESQPSAVVRYVLDSAAPKITVTSPKNNAVVNGKAVTLKGKTQARTTLLARNDANGSSVAGTAESDGSFTLSLALAAGTNQITISGTDPAGNQAETVLSVRRGTGKLMVALSASAYQIKRSKLPEAVTLTAMATDPDGRALPDAAYTFTLSIPGIPTVSVDGVTDANGQGTFKTTIPKGADLGQGSATVLITSDAFGSTQDYTVITIVK